MINRRQFFRSAGALAASFGLPNLVLAKTATNELELRAKPTDYVLPGEPYQASKLWLYDGTLPGP